MAYRIRLALARLQARVALVDHVEATTTANNLTVAVTRFQCFQ